MGWNWAAAADEVERARRALVPRGRPGHEENARRFRAAWEAAFPPGFFESLERCRRGEPGGLDDALDFLEACPRFFRTGYFASWLLHWLPRAPRTDEQAERMRRLVDSVLQRERRLPFRWIPSLARAVDSPAFRNDLRELASSPDPIVRERTHCVLDRMPGPPWDAERARIQRADARAAAMAVTAMRSRNANLLRRTLALDETQLGPEGRRSRAVAFEVALNWGLLPDDELLAIARRLDGPESARVLSSATERSDAPGERARWIRQQLRQS